MGVHLLARSNEVNTNPTASSRNLVLQLRLSSRSNYTESFRVLDRDSEFDLGFNLRNTRVRKDGRRVQNEANEINRRRREKMITQYMIK